MTSSGKTPRAVLLLGILLALAGITLFWFRKSSDSERVIRSGEAIPGGEASHSPARQPSRQHHDNDLPKPAPPPGTAAAANAEISALILDSLKKFRANHDPEEAKNILRLLREGIRQGPEDETAAAILAFLKTGEDAPTGLPFVVGPDGMMDTVPSLRTALLDLLPSLDPLSALRLARELMDQRTSPDEYALSLRNLAWNDLDGDLRNELTGRFMDLLDTPWKDQPSAGFLEAFDIAVEVGGSLVFDKLVSLSREAKANSNAAVSQAAFISLDRLILRNPKLLTTAFSDPAWMDFAPQQRASLLSRLDITDPEQRALFTRYLTSTSHAAGELDYFAKIFPNGNYLYGHRLVTADDTTPTIAEVIANDARVVGELNAMDSSVSGEAGTAIRKIRQRLEKSAGGNVSPGENSGQGTR